MRTVTMFHVLFLLSVITGCFLPVWSALSPQMVENSKKLMKNMCINRSGVQVEVLAATREGEFPEDRKLKCYMSCCLTFMKIMKKEKISYDSAVKQIESQLPTVMRPPMLESLNACKDVDGVDGCEVAFNYVKCAYEQTPSRQVVPT